MAVMSEHAAMSLGASSMLPVVHVDLCPHLDGFPTELQAVLFVSTHFVCTAVCLLQPTP